MKMALFLLLIPSLVDGQILEKVSQLPYTNRVVLEDEVVLSSKDPTKVTGYRTRRAAVSNIVEQSSPFDFPIKGLQHVVQNEWPMPITTNTRPFKLCNIGGEGVIRQVQILLARTDFGVMYTNMQYAYFNIAYDGNTIADERVPINALVGYNLYTNEFGSITTTNFDTDFFTIQDVATNAYFFMVKLKWPIPFTNGIRLWVDLTNSVAWPTTVGASTVVYQDVLGSVWNRNLRWHARYTQYDDNYATRTPGLFSIATNDFNLASIPLFGYGGINFANDVNKWIMISTDFWGTNVAPVPNSSTPVEAYIVSATDATHCIISVGGTNSAQTPFSNPNNYTYAVFTNQTYDVLVTDTYLNRPAGKFGYVASITVGWQTSAIDFNPHFVLNGDTTNFLSWPGTEDVFGGAYSFQHPKQLPENGPVVISKTPYWFSAYRHFKEILMPYTNGIVCSVNDSQPKKSNWCVVYYEK